MVPEYAAALCGVDGTAQELLKHGADLGAQDVDGITVRCKAAAADHRRAVELVFPTVECAAEEMRLPVAGEVRSVRNDLGVLLAADEDRVFVCGGLSGLCCGLFLVCVRRFLGSHCG